MSNPVFIVEPASFQVGICKVDGDEGHHAAAVKRIRVGEIVDLCDGNGRRGTGPVVETGKDFICVQVDEIRSEPAPKIRIITAQALAKGNRTELAIEIATEVGADEIIPWKAEHCIAKWDDSGKTLAKWQRIAREASKQSRRSRIPVVRDALNTAQLISELNNCAAVYVLHEDCELSLADVKVPTEGNLGVITGPEGGISEAELNQFRTAGFTIVRMGSTVMRTSTAGAIAIGVLASKTTRW